MIPKTVNICGIPYEIQIDNDAFNTDTEHLGQIDYKHCKIHIAADMPESMQMQTLLHEWVHGALWAIGYDDLRSDEKLVQNLAIAISQSFKMKASEWWKFEEDGRLVWMIEEET